MIRAGAVGVVVVLAVGWVAYVRAWRHDDVRPLAYRLVTLRHVAPARPVSRVTFHGSEEHVFISSGPRSSTGYSLEVRKAVVERDRVLIVVRERAEPGRAEITYPYRLLVFPRPHKPVHVHWEGRP